MDHVELRMLFKLPVKLSAPIWSSEIEMACKIAPSSV